MKKYLAFLLPVVLYSCGIQTRTTVTLNPDMSGKSVVEEKVGLDVAEILVAGKSSDVKNLYSNPFGGYDDTTSRTPKEVAMAFASQVLSSQGVETWRDVQYGLIGTDTVYFKGTAYFKDITKMGISMLDSMVQVSHNRNGETTLSFKSSQKQPKTDTATLGLSALESKSMPKGGAWSAMMHIYMASLLRGFDVRATYHLPGKIIFSTNFIRKDESTVEVNVTGEKMIKMMDTLMHGNSSAWLQLLDKSNPYAYNGLIFGESSPVEVTFKSNDKPLFDYNKEVTEAKKYYTAFRKTSGIEKYDSVQAAIKKQKEEEAEKEHGKLVVTAKDSANGKVYFKKLSVDQYWGTLSFSGEFSRGLNAGYYGYVTITKAYTDKGVNVLDSIQGHDSISAFLSAETYSFTDTAQSKKRVNFSTRAQFPDDYKILNIEGRLVIDASLSVAFKITNLYLKPKQSVEDYLKDR